MTRITLALQDSLKTSHQFSSRKPRRHCAVRRLTRWHRRILERPHSAPSFRDQFPLKTHKAQTGMCVNVMSHLIVLKKKKKTNFERISQKRSGRYAAIQAAVWFGRGRTAGSLREAAFLAAAWPKPCDEGTCVISPPEVAFRRWRQEKLCHVI